MLLLKLNSYIKNVAFFYSLSINLFLNGLSINYSYLFSFINKMFIYVFILFFNSMKHIELPLCMKCAIPINPT